MATLAASCGTTCPTSRPSALTPAQQDAVITAVRATEDKQWVRLNMRLTENTARVCANGVTIQDKRDSNLALAHGRVPGGFAEDLPQEAGLR